MLVVILEGRHIIAVIDADSLDDHELQLTLAYQKAQGRTWYFKLEDPKKIEVKPYEWEAFDNEK